MIQNCYKADTQTVWEISIESAYLINNVFLFLLPSHIYTIYWKEDGEVLQPQALLYVENCLNLELSFAIQISLIFQNTNVSCWFGDIWLANFRLEEMTPRSFYSTVSHKAILPAKGMALCNIQVPLNGNKKQNLHTQWYGLAPLWGFGQLSDSFHRKKCSVFHLYQRVQVKQGQSYIVCWFIYVGLQNHTLLFA